MELFSKLAALFKTEPTVVFVDDRVDTPALEEKTTQELETPRTEKNKNQTLNVGRSSVVGQVRTHNEDALITLTSEHLGDGSVGPFGLFVVADGMGGHQAGEVASSVAARVITHQVIQDVMLPYLFPHDTQTEPLNEALKIAINVANTAVHEQVPGGGTTLTCALILGRRAYIAHVGDSRAYLINQGQIKQLTQDHSFVGRLIELGELTPEEAAVHPQRNVLYRAVGQGEQLDIEPNAHLLPPSSHLLLCSDGLWGQVSDEEIKEIVESTDSIQLACQSLADAANLAGGTDNITAILVQVPGG